MRTIYTSLIILLITFSGCKKQNTFKDENGNEFIKIGDELYINPVQYEKTGKIYKVFLYNETSEDIGITKDLKIKPNESKIIDLKDTDTLALDNGIKFMFGDGYGLEVDDKKFQIKGIGGKFLDDYKVPDDARDWAFVIVPPGKGDGAND